MSDTAANIRRLIIHHHCEGRNHSEIGRLLQCDRRTVGRIIHQYNERGSTAVTRHGRCGRQRILSPYTARAIYRAAVSNPVTTARQIMQQVGQPAAHASLNTVRRSLRESGLVSYRPVAAPMLTTARKAVRLGWARQHCEWTTEHWKTVVFSDETTIEVSRPRSQYVRRGRGASIMAPHTTTRRAFAVKVMFWGFITHRGPGHLVPLDATVNGQRYLQLLQQHLGPIEAEFGGQDWFFQHDNAPSHKCLIVRNFLQDSGTQVLQWPPYSPDMNLIENLWSMLKRKVYLCSCNTREEVIQRANDTWNHDEEIQAAVASLYESMVRRVAVLRRSRGGYSGY